jgi:hypothetical protein
MRLLGFCECCSIMLPHRTYSSSTAPQYVLIECVATEANDMLLCPGTKHPEGRRAGYHIDSEQR